MNGRGVDDHVGLRGPRLGHPSSIPEWRQHRLRLVVLLPVALLAACDFGALVAIDGGADHDDAGQRTDQDGGTDTDAGESADAGSPSDAGVPDAGASDAGPTRCVFAENPPIPFSCEGDEDWCDPLGDASYAEADLLAVWSRIEGDEWVIDVRFSAAPFRLIPYEGIVVMFDDAPPGTPALEMAIRVGSTDRLVGSLAVLVDSKIADNGPYPPAIGSRPAGLPLEACSMFLLGHATPLFEFRLPVSWLITTEGESIDYVVGSQHAPIGEPWDVTWSGPAAFNRSAGGAPDDLSDLVSSCTIGCPVIE